MTKKILIPIMALCLLLSGCTKSKSTEKAPTETASTSSKNVLLTVNGEPIYKEELEKIKSKYEKNGLTESEIVEGMILELITLQQADELSISVSQEDVDSRYNELVDLEQPLFYEKAIEQYGSEENYKDALYYRLIYDEVSTKIKESFSDTFSINNALLQERTQDYISQYTSADFEENNINEKDFSKEVAQTYNESFLSALEDLYFKVWQYQESQICELSFDNYNGNNLFQVQEYDITTDTLQFRGKSYEMKEITLEEIKDRFGNYFYLPDSIEDSYGAINGKAIHVPAKDVRGLYLTLGTDPPVTIKLIVSPILSLYNDFQENGIIERTENGLNKIEYVQPDLGIYYSITAKMEYTELENFLNSYIPYTQTDNTLNSKDDSNIITSINNFTQKIELTNGSLFFNDYIPVANDIAYFNPDTTHTERWDLEQVTEYLGTSFYPSYVPETLKLCEDFYSGTFISEYIDKSMYWTVAFEGDAVPPIYDNFGLFYSDSFDDEYNPLRKNLYIEVSKNKIPESDTVYSYETTEKSKIGNTELTIGFYKAPYYDGEEEPTGYSEYFVAEFMVDNVGYRIKSENLSQEDFIKILTSIPVFQ